ncbi:hypothetical protein EV193_106179 [Herbihabitans rhizosphaerae]|uniref:non-specific serine/threonine protein kinase n=1 Tax=Herbihabitans rhizosphaerae TaxID=1872711 RepID=A0A4Q7KKF3_9PSEU|nr:serine/threonine-protein kinase [Herbihabitans rhizosphaerae]RZS36945.1 hypothetical protein EV193_106179 [Herbihabitans rhizosphaerae]
MTDEGSLVAGRYRLGQRIGSGAMGVVWQAHDERLHRTVAVKQLLHRPGLSTAQSEEARARSMREGRIAARLQHSNAITVYDVAQHDGDPWLIMEYLPSQSLAAVIDERGVLSPEETARIGAEVASALEAAHAAGIVHRDVKPANVLLGDDGSVKITDFGISRATGDVTVTATGMLAGTPAYLAPEVAKGHDPTPASDVFSLGSTLYTAVEGRSPFGLSENTFALLHAVAAGAVTPPRQAGPLTALLMQLLRSEPTERPTMTAAQEALAAVATGRSVTPGLLSPAGPTQAIPLVPPTPIPPPTQPAHSGTRIDPHPFAEPHPTPPPTQPPHQSQQAHVPYHGPPPAKKTNTRAIVLTVLAILLAAAIGVLVAVLLTNRENDASPPPASSSAPPPPATTEKRTTTSKPPTTTATTTTPTTTSYKPTAADLEKAVREYYSLLLTQRDEAWSRLSPRAQQKTRGRETWEKFVDGLESAEAGNTRAVGSTVFAQIKFETKKDKESREGYVFTMIEKDGKILIDDYIQIPGGGER